MMPNCSNLFPIQIVAALKYVTQRKLMRLFARKLILSYERKSGGGELLVFEVGYHTRKKIHVIRVVFQLQTMYARLSFRGAKTCKIGKKGVFLVIVTNYGKDMTDKLRKSMKKRVSRVYFHT